VTQERYRKLEAFERESGPSQDLRSADNVSILLGVMSINLSLMGVPEGEHDSA
jgi:hypothetical protein